MPKNSAVGVIVGRFQVDALHFGHQHLIGFVRDQHDDVLLVLGVRHGARSKLYPLKFGEREQMIRELYGSAVRIAALSDNPIDPKFWSRHLDDLIEEMYPGRPAILYGSRQSFIPLYSGKFPAVEVPVLVAGSGTKVRAEMKFPGNRDARAAIIYEIENRYPFMYSTSDLAIVDKQQGRILLIGKNQHEGYLSFVGGHAGKEDPGAMAVARREASEEIPGVEFGELRYLDTLTIDDPRYRGTPDGIMTTFFEAPYLGGVAKPSDDADTAEWVGKGELISRLVPWHRRLGNLLLDRW